MAEIPLIYHDWLISLNQENGSLFEFNKGYLLN